MAHSFVRGNWRNDQLSSPIIMQKSCHDLDILLWLTDAHCTKVAAFGSLSTSKKKTPHQALLSAAWTAPEPRIAGSMPGKHTSRSWANGPRTWFVWNPQRMLYEKP